MEFTPNGEFVAEWLNSTDCLDVLTDVGDDVHNIFDAIAPRDTGNMVKSTGLIPRHSTTSWELDLTIRIYYGKFVEFGTRYMRAQHNLENSLKINQAINGR